jgi:hypothetical protein
VRRLTKIYGAVSAAAIGMAVVAVPASAHSPVVATCTGTANVQAGTAVKTDPRDQGLNVFEDRWFDWQLVDAKCDTDGDGVNDSTLDAEGTDAFGRCGASDAPFNGAGTIVRDDGTHTVGLFELGWLQSAGTILPVTGKHDHGGTGTVTATVQASGGEACTTEHGATTFSVRIVATLS